MISSYSISFFSSFACKNGLKEIYEKKFKIFEMKIIKYKPNIPLNLLLTHINYQDFGRKFSNLNMGISFYLF